MEILVQKAKLNTFLLLLFLMIVFPMTTELLYIKAFIFFIILLLVMIDGYINKKNLIIDKRTAIMVLIFISFSIFSSLHGLLLQTPGALKQAQLYIFWPVVYILICFSFNKISEYNKIRKIILFSVYFIILYGFMKTLNFLGIINFPFSFDFPSFEEAITKDGWVIQMRYPGINSMAYGIGFILGIIYTNLLAGKNRTIAIIQILGLILFTFISGRRVYFLILITMFILIYNIKVINAKKRNSFGVIVSLFAIISVTIFYLNNSYFDIRSVYNFGLSSFDSVEVGNELRNIQFVKLLKGWLENPLTFLIGHGHGSFSDEIIRSIDMPWTYELYYNALLFQTGLIGFVIYVSFFLFIIYRGIKILKKIDTNYKIVLPFITGLISLLIASATNPYLVRFDGLWAVFIPLGIINYYSNDKIKIKINDK
ncbi:O-antigen ligase family protein [Peribacillus sp. B-H-3]|uniref:O-antigen ligase family protein n=1 Tax=Peribacillus sp. B-H-3 TaxID=3400420 RepID=UPI003B01F3DE